MAVTAADKTRIATAAEAISFSLRGEGRENRESPGYLAEVGDMFPPSALGSAQLSSG
jgi:hypothetical protein